MTGRHRTPAAPTRATRILMATALAVVAFFNGSGQATLGTRVTDIQKSRGLSYTQLGRLLAGFPLGLLIGGLLATVLSDRIGSRLTLAIGALLYWGALAGVGVGLLFGWPLLVLAVVWGLGGLGNAFLDVGQGAHSTAGQSVLAFQAAEKLGAFGAGIVGTVAIATHLGAPQNLLLVGGLSLVLGGAAAILLPRIAHGSSTEETPAVWVHPRRGRVSDELGRWRLLLLGVIAAGTAVPLLTAIDWGGPILKAVGAPKALTATVVVTFPLAAVLGLWVAHALWRRLRPERVGRIGAVISLAGVGLLAGDLVIGGQIRIPTAIAAFGLLGFGLAPVAGTAQKAASNGRSGRLGLHARIGVVVVVQYVSGSAAPVLVGALASRFGVIAAVAYVNAACALAVLAMAGLLWYAQPADHTTAVPGIVTRRRRKALQASRPAGRHRHDARQAIPPAGRHQRNARQAIPPAGRHRRSAQRPAPRESEEGS